MCCKIRKHDESWVLLCCLHRHRAWLAKMRELLPALLERMSWSSVSTSKWHTREGRPRRPHVCALALNLGPRLLSSIRHCLLSQADSWNSHLLTPPTSTADYHSARPRVSWHQGFRFHSCPKKSWFPVQNWPCRVASVMGSVRCFPVRCCRSGTSCCRFLTTQIRSEFRRPFRYLYQFRDSRKS